jgi:phosphatidylserine/phosphatidylglycerophosphate/cardiolipin synthase-like enzyme
MRKHASQGGVTVQAIAGNHAVYFGLDLADDVRPGCLGWSVHRTDHTEHKGKWLAGFKTFRSVVPNPDPQVIYSSEEHPIQSFYWGDYSAKPAHDYTYRFVPRFGAPAALAAEAGVEASVDLSTSDPGAGRHGIFFNRGVAASQAYAREFGAPPDQLPEPKRSEALTWLSRGLIEAMQAFIAQASSGEFALRAAVYEFTQEQVLDVFKAAHDAGADVRIVYHALSDETGAANRAAIHARGLDADPSLMIPRTRASIAHNKFIVFCTKGADGTLTPVSVWTGSTNISEGGIYGHSNVGHAVQDAEVAARYLDFWSELEGDPDLDSLRAWSTANSQFDPATAAAGGIGTIFSPRNGLGPLRWYASEFANGADVSAHVTMPFGMTKVFEDDLTPYAGPALHFVLLDERDSNQDVWAQSRQVVVAVGALGGPDELARWAKEQLTGFNVHVPYLHTKILLVDPLSASPTVITGSANFSPNSTDLNDENMLVIPGDLDVADVYLTEFARIFQHFYARYWASQLSQGGNAQTQSFLSEDPSWQDPYFQAGHQKYLLRRLYSSQVQGNV